MVPPMKNPYSPFKKKVGKVSSKNKDTGHTLICVGFPNTNIELYQYTKVNSGQERENYTYHFRKNFDGDDKFSVPHLEEAGFIGYYYLRGTGNIRKNGSDGYPRYNLMRIVPGENTTSAETRMEGLNVLSTFFKSIRYSKYPPSHIQCSDNTAQGPGSLDKYLLDKDIFSLLANVFEESVLNSEFFSSFPDIAPVIFGGPEYPPEAIEKLGYRETNAANGAKGNYHPSFVPPEQQEETETRKGDETESPEDEEQVEHDSGDEDETNRKKRSSASKKGEPKSKKQKTKN